LVTVVSVRICRVCRLVDVIAAIVVAVFVVVIVVDGGGHLLLDGRRAARRGKPFPVAQPTGVTIVDASWQRAGDISRDAIRTLGASDFSVINGVGVVGWKGNAYWRGSPKNRPFEMGVLIYPLEGECKQLVSYARPRFSRTDSWMGGRDSLALGAALAREVSRRSAEGVGGR
jgi:hypothetical protein